MGVPDSWEEHVKLMFDLQVLAFAADITRVSSFKMSRDITNRVFPESGNRTPFHSASHHGSTPARILDYCKINKYHVSLVSYFLDKLKHTPDGDGTLLDHSLILYGSPMGDSNVHAHKRVPMLLAGHANGRLKGNRHIAVEKKEPTANLLLAMGELAGAEIESIGHSNGRLSL